MVKIELLFSDVSFGTHEYGFIPRSLNSEDSENSSEQEDREYQRFLRKSNPQARVVEGIVIIPS